MGLGPIKERKKGELGRRELEQGPALREEKGQVRRSQRAYQEG